MKRNLIAACVGFALAAPAAVLADTTLYGRAHLSLDSIDNGDSTDTYLSSNSSRLGVKGSEDLGNGLAAMFQLEGSIDWDGGGTWGASRNTYVGIKGGFGSFLAGQHDTPFKALGGAVDFFGDQVGDNSNVVGVGYKGDKWDNRFKNVVLYATPEMNGLQGKLAYQLKEEGSKDALSGAVTWKGGDLKLGLGYELHEDDTKKPDESAWRLTAAHAFGDASVAALYQSVSDAGYTKGADYDVWGIGGAYKMGDTRLKAQYYKTDDVDGVPKSGGSLWAAGVEQKLSKRTTIYAVYGATDNDGDALTGATFSPYADGRNAKPGVEKGESASAFSLGMVHNF